VHFVERSHSLSHRSRVDPGDGLSIGRVGSTRRISKRGHMLTFPYRVKLKMFEHHTWHPWFRLVRYARRGGVAFYTIRSHRVLSGWKSLGIPLRHVGGNLPKFIIDRKLRVETLSQMEVLKPGDVRGLFSGMDSTWQLAVKVPRRRSKVEPGLPPHRKRSTLRSMLAGLLRCLLDAFRSSSSNVDIPSPAQVLGQQFAKEIAQNIRSRVLLDRALALVPTKNIGYKPQSPSSRP
jgi:hypothetical protein